MIALTQEKREELIKECEFEIKSLKDRIYRKYAANNSQHKKYLKDALVRQELALESLTAESIGKITEETIESSEGCYLVASKFKGVFNLGANSPADGEIYAVPPVPEIKLPEIKDYADPHTQYREGLVDGYNHCLAEIKRLNGLGE